MPIRQRDRRVVGMTDSAFCVNARIPSQCLPTPLHSTWSVLQQLTVASFAHAVRVFWAHVNEFACHAEELFHDVRLARIATQRLVVKDELFVYRIAIPRCRRHKEPFTLTTERRVLAAVAQPGGSLGFRDRGITALPTIRIGQGGRSCTCDLVVPNKAVCC